MPEWWTDLDEQHYQRFAELMRAGYSHDVALFGAAIRLERARALGAYRDDQERQMRLTRWALADVIVRARARWLRRDRVTT